jgi:hypothetical protein
MGVNYNTSIVTDGLVLCLDAANKRSYPGSGNTWFDLSGFGSNSDLLSGATYDINNNGLILLDGLSGNSRVGTYIDSELFTDDSSLTVGIFVNIDESDKNIRGGLLTSQRWVSESDPGGFGFVINSDGVLGVSFTKEIDGIKTQYSSVASFHFIREQFKYYVFTYNNINKEITTYMDANIQNSSINTNYAWTVNSSNRRTIIGRNTQGGWGGSYRMFIGCVHLYNRSLLPKEISQNFNALRGRYGI